jgi:hypothetical protein
MRMPDEMFALVQRFADVYPPPHGFAGEAHDEACRGWTRHLAEQAVFTFPAAGYGCKRASDDRPLSKDVIACFGGAVLMGWDVLIGAGTGAPAVIGAPGESLDLTGQVFVAVTGRDWLAEAGASASPSPSAPTNDCNECSLLQTMVEALVGLRDDMSIIKSELASANEQRQVQIAELARIFSRLQATPTLEQLQSSPVLVKFKW